jgi:hypothetical protein
VTEQLLQQQLESPSGTGRVEPRSNHQPDSPHPQRTGCQQADPILTGSYAWRFPFAAFRTRSLLSLRRSAITSARVVSRATTFLNSIVA